MNPAEIYDALAGIAAKGYDPVEFPFAFAAATDNNPGTIAKLRNGSFNKSDLPDAETLSMLFVAKSQLVWETSNPTSK